jgi:transposase
MMLSTSLTRGHATVQPAASGGARIRPFLGRRARRYPSSTPSARYCALEDCRHVSGNLERFLIGDGELAALVRARAPELLELPGCGTLCAAKLIAEVAGVERFPDHAKLAMLAGVAPLDATSGRQRRHRLNRKGKPRAEPGLASDRRLPGPRPPAGEGVPGAQASRGQEPPRGASLPEAPLARVVWQKLRVANSERMTSISPNLREIEVPTHALALT